MISKNMLLKEPLFNPFGDTEFCNLYTYHAEDSYKQLKLIYNKKIAFCSDNYAMLANTFERMYKGIIEEYINICPEYVPTAGMMDTHQLHLLAQEVHVNIFPIINNKETYPFLLDKLEAISKGYTHSRYAELYEYSDFVKAFDLFEKQRKFLYERLDVLKKEPIKKTDEIDINFD